MAPEPLPDFIPTPPAQGNITLSPTIIQPPETPSGKTDVGVSKINLPYYPNAAKKP